MRETQGQIDDLLAEVRARAERRERVLVTTLTKKMAEDLTDYLLEMDVKAHYLHSEIDTLERVDILRDLRQGVYDVVVGINLLREGLDLPEVSLVCILDADKEGYLRSGGSLIQTNRSRRPPRRGPRDHVRRRRHAVDAHRPRRDGSGGARSSSPGTSATASSRRASARRSATSPTACGSPRSRRPTSSPRTCPGTSCYG